MLPMTKAMAIENTFHVKRLARASINLDETPVKDPSPNAVTRLTNLKYHVCYNPLVKVRVHKDGPDVKRKALYPFMVFCDMFALRGIMRFRDWEDFSSSKDPAAIWLLRNTKVSRETFEFAKANPWLDVPFQVNYSAYAKKIGTRKVDFSYEMKMAETKTAMEPVEKGNYVRKEDKVYGPDSVTIRRKPKKTVAGAQGGPTDDPRRV